MKQFPSILRLWKGQAPMYEKPLSQPASLLAVSAAGLRKQMCTEDERVSSSVCSQQAHSGPLLCFKTGITRPNMPLHLEEECETADIAHQQLSASHFKTVWGFPHRQHKLLYPVLCKEVFQQLSQPFHAQPHQLFRLPCWYRHIGHTMWTQDFNAKENPFIAAAAVQRKGGETQLLQEVCGIDLCCFSPIARDQWGVKSKSKMALTGMNFYKHPPTTSASLHIS